MTAHNNDEVEIKFLVHNTETLLRSLGAAGFHEKTASTFESNTLYDNASGDLRKAGEVLRLRLYGDKWRVTHKTRGTATKHKSRTEHETAVDNGEEMHAIFTALGYRPSFRYEKYRAEYTDGEGEVVIDRTPIGTIAEIEGAPDWIDHTARALGVVERDYITMSYAEMFLQWKRRTKSPAQNMTFDECGTSRPYRNFGNSVRVSIPKAISRSPMATSSVNSTLVISHPGTRHTTPRTVWFISAAVFVLLMAIAPRYGYFRDELYYLACGEHPALGYVDQPPLICWTAWLLEHTIGTSIYALRLLPALAAALTVWMTARLARELGGSHGAQILAAIIAAAMPVLIGIAHLFTMNIFDFVLWTQLVLILARLENTGNPRLWLWFGAITGITVLNKYAVIFFLVALILGTLATPWRRWLASAYFWSGTLIAVVIALPNFLWQWLWHFPFLELMANIRHNGRDVALPPLGFFLQQLQIVNPVSMLVVFCGLIYLLRNKRYRALGIAFAAFYVIMMLLKAKNYYLAPVYPMVFAAGSVALMQWSDRPRLRWIPATIGGLAMAVFVLAVPILIPVLTVPQFQKYVQVTRIKTPEFEHHGRAALPQLYADMFGWEEMVEKTAAFYNSLTPEQKRRTVIWGDNYGEAGAIDFFGPRYGLPKALSGHQSYFVWGPRNYHRPDVINLGSHDDETLRRECDSVRVIGRADHPLSRSEEHFDIYYCQGLGVDVQQVWPKVKRWN